MKEETGVSISHTAHVGSILVDKNKQTWAQISA